MPPPVQKEYDALHEKHLEELAALEEKYIALYNPLFLKRKDIVLGAVDPAVEAPAEAGAGECCSAFSCVSVWRMRCVRVRCTRTVVLSCALRSSSSSSSLGLTRARVCVCVQVRLTGPPRLPAMRPLRPPPRLAQ